MREVVINGHDKRAIDILTVGNNTIEGCYIGLNAIGTAAVANTDKGLKCDTGANNNTIGGTTAAQRNVISGNTNDGMEIKSTGNVIQGNYIGLSADGATAIGNTADGIELKGLNNTIGGTSSNQRNVISGNVVGMHVKDAPCIGNDIQGNYIGLNAAGTLARPNTTYGIWVENSATSNVIGGTASGAGNVISGNTSHGILIEDAGTNSNEVKGNLIGLNPAGTAGIANGGHGIQIGNSAMSCVIGGTASGAANTIAHNTGDGVYLIGAATDNNLISANSIYSNGGLGIDLDPDGVGTGGGANNDKARPTITSVVLGVSDFTVTATVTSGDVIEFFRVNNDASPVVTADGTGAGEGYLYLGSCIDNGATSGPYIQAGSDGNGAGGTIVVVLLPPGLNGGDSVTATVRDASNNTSEFSNNMSATAPDIIVLKSLSTVYDPYNGTTNPKAIPGGHVLYTASVSNEGDGSPDANTVFLEDAIPTNNALFVDDIDVPGSGPALFTDGATASGLTYTFTSLSSATDDISFSDDSGSTWTYVPTADGDGFDSAVTDIQINPQGTMNTASGGNIPSFTLEFKVRVD